jgi:Flp pilus assembly pilin Flp
MLTWWICLRNGAALRNERGQTLTEYALLLMLIALALIAAVRFFGGELNAVWSRVSSEVIAAGA